MKATEHPKNPANQPFQISGAKKTTKNSRWNPSSPTYWVSKKNK